MRVEFGKCLLRELLEKNRIHQYELVDKSSKSKTQISDYIHGRKYMSYKTAVEFAMIIGCHAEDLYDWKIE